MYSEWTPKHTEPPSRIDPAEGGISELLHSSHTTPREKKDLEGGKTEWEIWESNTNAVSSDKYVLSPANVKATLKLPEYGNHSE